MTVPGVVIFRGQSRLGRGGPIVVIVTFASHNTKTGDIAQAWVLRADIAPNEAIRDGQDRAICGDCVHRSGSHLGRSCYVIIHLGPRNVYKAFLRGLYPDVTPEEAGRGLAGSAIRVAAYGDPAAAPFEVWRALLAYARPIAYSHSWRVCDSRFSRFCMASVESEHEADQAHALGWRTFRTRLATEGVRVDEIICPASNEAGHRTTCSSCGLCSGQARGAARSIAIIAHGQRTRHFEDRKAAAV